MALGCIFAVCFPKRFHHGIDWLQPLTCIVPRNQQAQSYPQHDYIFRESNSAIFIFVIPPNGGQLIQDLFP